MTDAQILDVIDACPSAYNTLRLIGCAREDAAQLCALTAARPCLHCEEPGIGIGILDLGAGALVFSVCRAHAGVCGPALDTALRTAPKQKVAVAYDPAGAEQFAKELDYTLKHGAPLAPAAAQVAWLEQKQLRTITPQQRSVRRRRRDLH
jgi:hypothetical protein